MSSNVIQSDTIHLISRLVREHGRNHWRGYVFAFACMGGIAGSTSLAAWLMRDVINKVFLDRDAQAVIWLAVSVVVIYTVKGLSTYGQQVTLSRIANSIVASVQRSIYSHLLKMDMRYFMARHTSEFVGRQAFMASSCGGVLNTVVTSLGRDLLSLVGLMLVMILQDPLMSVVGLIMMPAAVIGVQKLIKRARKIMHTSYTQGVAVMELTQETVAGIKVVKSLGLETRFTNLMDISILEVERAANKLVSVGARSAPLMETLGGFAVAGVILYGGIRVISAEATPGSFFSFITALLLAYEPAKRLARVHIELATNLVGVKVMYDFLAEPTGEAPEDDKPALVLEKGRIVFTDVRFRYRPDEVVLRGLNLVAEAGRTTALVGRSGGGKSTILSLLLRFYDLEGGVIEVDGHDISTVDRRTLRRQIAYVGQDVFLFKGTVYENIALGRQGATRDEVEAAAKAAHAHEFIMGFTEGYDTNLGENGGQLSGGQRQRIAIARAILQNAPILLLDEATAALDNESERKIQQALAELSTGRTTLVIAHRLQTVRNADKICVVEHGVVVEEGPHDELLSRGGRYAALHQLHFNTKPKGVDA
ncbi:MAG: ABC transporter ATP-binding protein/permease [Hyphomicrobiales bacterium]|nr:ABC transporter ATP-binding protein/permease [Hyphomicrobiales bacterium]